MPYIYLLTNTVTGDEYIGFTSQDLTKRIKQHSYKSSGCRLIKKAIKQYGMNAFKCTILEHSPDANDNDRFLNVLEPYYISKYNPTYNMTTGGDGTGTILGPRYKSRVPLFNMIWTASSSRDGIPPKKRVMDLTSYHQVLLMFAKKTTEVIVLVGINGDMMQKMCSHCHQ